MPKTNYTFTVEEILDAAAKDLLPNFNDAFIEYESIEYTPRIKRGKVLHACVIGEAFLNLGLTENGKTAASLSFALEGVAPDNPSGVTLNISRKEYEEDDFATGVVAITYRDLSDFINNLNSYKGWRGKKRIVRLAKKYFSNSLQQKVTI